MENIYDVDQIAPWRNDPNAVAAHRAVREWHVLDRKEQAVAVTNKSTVRAKQALVIAFGLALLEGKKGKSNKAFKDWVEYNELNESPFDNPSERSHAMRVAVLGNYPRLDDCPHSLPSNIMKWARKTGLVQPKRRNGSATSAARAHVRQAVAEGKPINRDEVSRDTGAADGTVNMAVAIERARLEGIEEGKALVGEPHFTKAQQHHIDAAIKREQKELIREHNTRVRELEKQFDAEVEARFQARKAVAWPALEKEKQEARVTKARYQKLLDGRDYPFPKTTYYDLLFLSHNKEVSEERKTRISQYLIANKLRLIGEE